MNMGMVLGVPATKALFNTSGKGQGFPHQLEQTNQAPQCRESPCFDQHMLTVTLLLNSHSAILWRTSWVKKTRNVKSGSGILMIVHVKRLLIRVLQ